MRFSISPSKLGRFFYHNCERQLVAASAQLPTTSSPEEPTEKVVELLQHSGYAWEEKVVAEFLAGRAVIAVDDAPLSERFFPSEVSLQKLEQLKEGEYLYQPTLRVKPDFHRRFGLDPELIHFPACRPDLLWCNDGMITIIDVKASEALKASHRVQVAFYALILEHLLKQAGSPLKVDQVKGGIWLYECDEPELFELGPSLLVLKNFLRDQLENILTQPFEQAFWHLTPRCEWCEMFQHCEKQAKTEQRVSLIPGLTQGGGLYLRDHLKTQNLQELESCLSSGDSETYLKNCGSLSGRSRRLRKSSQSLRSHQILLHGGVTARLPISEQVQVILSVQKEPVSGRVYGCSFLRNGGSQAYPTTSNLWVEVAERAEDCERLHLDFFNALYQELETLHRFNRGKSWDQQLSLQCYSFDQMEVELFTDLLFSHLEHSRQITQLLLYFQNENVAEAQEHPVQEVAHPLVSVQALVQEMMAIPEPVAFQLQTTLKHLAPQSPESSAIDPQFHYRFNGALRPGPILKVWEQGSGRGTGRIRREFVKRLRATALTVKSLRAQLSQKLFAWPQKFTFPKFQNFNNPQLSRVAFVIRYEALLRALQVREARAKSYLERLHTNTTVVLRKLNDCHWRVVSKLPAEQFDDGAGFPCFLLSRPGREGDKAQMSFDDLSNCRSTWTKASGLDIVGITETTVDPETHLVTELILKGPKSLNEVAPGESFHLHPRFTDYTSQRMVDCLVDWDKQSSNLLSRLLEEPSAIGLLENPGDEPLARDLTASQRLALNKLWRHRLSLVWGPPGTGKTHFIASAVKALMAANTTFTVAVTAFTHAAVENVLRKLLTQNLSFPVRKINKVRGASAGLTAIALDELYELRSAWVLGGTVYDLAKAQKKGIMVDLLVVDEGSQMKWGELALGLGILKRGGRLLLAGDDLQLPPILCGTYPPAKDHGPSIEDSVFAYLRAKDHPERPYTTQLQESWRMNKTLSAFTAETLYGPEYGPATTTIASQRLRLELLGHWLDPILDPNFPLVVCILEDVQAAQENVVEAQIVAELASILRTQVPSIQDDKSFWSERLFIVSPHHLQIRAIQRALAQSRDWDCKPFVDTVDKMQGQEAESVIVSYGVSDRESALREAEFLYSLNRLNVSVTRARSKCIVFLPRPLLAPNFELLSSDKAAKGLGHMLALVDFCQSHGERVELSQGPSMTVWRA